MPVKTTCHLLFLWCLPFLVSSQTMKPGFNKEEYRELMLINVQTRADTQYIEQFPFPSTYKMVYQSAPIGLDNLWDFWTSDHQSAVISLRGTTANPESWLANFYAAMVPAKGELRISEDFIFGYDLAAHPKAAVHVGWLLSMAILSREIVPQIHKAYEDGKRDFFIIGHSQGGAIAYLLTSYLHNLQETKQLPGEIRFKTYCSAAPKPGNLYYAYAYEALTQDGWAYNVVNAADWVPEVPVSIQTLQDFNHVNPFMHAKAMIRKQKFPKNLVLKHVYNQLDKPTRKAQRRYQKYLGNMASKMIGKKITGFSPPDYYNSNHYVRTGNTIVLVPDADYYTQFPDDPAKLFPHHFHQPYLTLLEKQP